LSGDEDEDIEDAQDDDRENRYYIAKGKAVLVPTDASSVASAYNQKARRPIILKQH
jgi:hypothetical protein